jgi:RNA polymerase sigma-70 factor (ECF subfamily)
MENELEKDFLDMIAAHERVIYKVCYFCAKNHDELDDLFQEIVLNLWKSFPNFRGESKITTWIYRIATNTCINSQRYAHDRLKMVPLTTDEVRNLTTDDDREGLFQELHEHIDQLSEKERALILLWLEDMSYQAMADILGTTTNNIGVKLCHIKHKLRKM